MSDLVAQKHNHVNFYNKYLLLLEYTDEHWSTACNNWSGCGPEKSHMSEAGRTWWMPGDASVGGLPWAAAPWLWAGCWTVNFPVDLMQPLAELTAGVSARRLAFVLLSWCRCSCDCCRCVGGPRLYTLSLGGMWTDGHWSYRGEHWLGSSCFTMGGSHKCLQLL
jgi:hypothetical protein